MSKPLTDVCEINTVNGTMKISMHEALPEELEEMDTLWPIPNEPMTTKNIPVETASGENLLKKVSVPETNPEKLLAHKKNKAKIMDYRMAAYVEACIDQEDKPEGSLKDRVEFIIKLSQGIKNILYDVADRLNRRRLPERIEEAKKE